MWSFSLGSRCRQHPSVQWVTTHVLVLLMQRSRHSCRRYEYDFLQTKSSFLLSRCRMHQHVGKVLLAVWKMSQLPPGSRGSRYTLLRTSQQLDLLPLSPPIINYITHSFAVRSLSIQPIRYFQNVRRHDSGFSCQHSSQTILIQRLPYRACPPFRSPQPNMKYSQHQRTFDILEAPVGR